MSTAQPSHSHGPAMTHLSVVITLSVPDYTSHHTPHNSCLTPSSHFLFYRERVYGVYALAYNFSLSKSLASRTTCILTSLIILLPIEHQVTPHLIPILFVCICGQYFGSNIPPHYTIPWPTTHNKTLRTTNYWQ